MAADRDLLTVGVITGAHGIGGEVKLKSFTEDPEAIATYDGLVLETGDPVRIMRLSPARTGFVARLAGIDTRNDAEALKGRALKLPREKLPPAGDGAFYHADLIGLDVRLGDGEVLGRITAVHDFGAGPLLDVALSSAAGTVLLPFTHDCVPEVDVAAGFVVAVPPDGLIED